MSREEANRQALEHAVRWLVLMLALTAAALYLRSLVALAFCFLVDVSALRHLAALYRSSCGDLTVSMVAVPATIARYVLLENPADLSGLVRLAAAVLVDVAIVATGVWMMKIQSRL